MEQIMCLCGLIWNDFYGGYAVNKYECCVSAKVFILDFHLMWKNKIDFRFNIIFNLKYILLRGV